MHDLSPRMDYAAFTETAGGAAAALQALGKAVDASGLDKTLTELVKLRASQINGCAFCIDMHTKDARARGESEQRLYTLQVWREVTFFSERERAALAWTEAVTEIGKQGLPDAVYEGGLRHFTEKELVDLTLAVIAINGWNRLAISFRVPAGIYHPARRGNERGKS